MKNKGLERVISKNRPLLIKKDIIKVFFYENGLLKSKNLNSVNIDKIKSLSVIEDLKDNTISICIIGDKEYFFGLENNGKPIKNEIRDIVLFKIDNIYKNMFIKPYYTFITVDKDGNNTLRYMD